MLTFTSFRIHQESSGLTFIYIYKKIPTASLMYSKTRKRKQLAIAYRTWYLRAANSLLALSLSSTAIPPMQSVAKPGLQSFEASSCRLSLADTTEKIILRYTNCVSTPFTPPPPHFHPHRLLRPPLPPSSPLSSPDVFRRSCCQDEKGVVRGMYPVRDSTRPSTIALLLCYVRCRQSTVLTTHGDPQWSLPERL